MREEKKNIIKSSPLERKKGEGTCERERWIGEGVEERKGRGRRVGKVIGKRESEGVVVGAVWR